MTLSREQWWEKAVDFHGHSCPGLAVGVRLALDFRQTIGLEGPAGDEELAALSETDACGVDGLQVVLGCTAGQGNLWVRARGKHVFTLWRSSGGPGLRYSWRGAFQGGSRREMTEYFLGGPREELYDCRPSERPRPPRAAAHRSHPCHECGELTAEPNLRVREGELICLDCAGLPFDLSRRLAL